MISFGILNSLLVPLMEGMIIGLILEEADGLFISKVKEKRNRREQGSR